MLFICSVCILSFNFKFVLHKFSENCKKKFFSIFWIFAKTYAVEAEVLGFQGKVALIALTADA